MTRRRKRIPRKKTVPKEPVIAPHAMTADLTITADPWTGRRICTTCGALGTPGDQRHTAGVQPPPQQPAHLREAHAARDAAILGETGEHQ